MKRIDTSQYVIHLLLAAVLIFWGYQNLFPIEIYEARLAEQLFGNWYIAAILPRLVIALKFMLAAFLILNINPRKILPKAILAVMAFHVFDLLWESQVGNGIIDKSYTAIFDNPALNYLLVIFVLANSLYMLFRGRATGLHIKWIKYPLALVLIALPFIFNPVFPHNFTEQAEIIDEPFDAGEIANEKLQALSDKTVLLGLFSTGCPHCLNAARRIAVSQKKCEGFPPVFICFYGTEEGVENFYSQANTEFEYTTVNASEMSKLHKLVFPTFMWLENGTIKKKWNGRSFSFYTLSQLCQGRH